MTERHLSVAASEASGPTERAMLGKSAIDILTMANPDNLDNQYVGIYGVNNSIISYSNTVCILAAS
jgi:hypothetical protein